MVGDGAVNARTVFHSWEVREEVFDAGNGGAQQAPPHVALAVLRSPDEGNCQTSTPDRGEVITPYQQTAMSRADQQLSDNANANANAAAYVVSSLEFKDLVDFLQNKQDCEHKFEIRVPLNNDPPSIVFPRKFCQDLLKYARERVKARIADGILHDARAIEAFSG
ncbi:hypothetical protein DV738_g4463, partial [Chaetothyriales sp. CBS 135597]